MTNQFTHAIAIKPLGLMYASTGAFLSPENLVGASNTKFPPDAPTLSGIYAAHYGKDSDELKSLQLAGSFWGRDGAESDFYVPTPFNYLVLKGQDHIIAGLIPLGDRWRLPNGNLPPEEKYNKHSWLRLSDWQYLNNFEGNVPRTTTGKAIAVASDPWESLPHLHPRLDREQRIVYDDEESNLGSLYLENSVQLPDDVCLIYLANVSLPEGWYRFGGEGHLVEITSYPLNEKVTQLLNQPLGNTFALISPGVWGTNRFSFLEPRTLVRESGKPDVVEQQWHVSTRMSDRPQAFRYRLGKKNADDPDYLPKLLSRGRYAVPPGSVYVVDEPLPPWYQWHESEWFPQEAYSYKRWGSSLALPLSIGE
ncbi:MAG: type III-B CRISPR module-associated Cmr3 family protein [Cyanobacteria bacterium P01_A01_bin.40]